MSKNIKVVPFPPFKRSGTTITQRTAGDDVDLLSGSIHLNDDETIRLGNTLAANDVQLSWNTAQTVDALYLGLSDGQNTFIIAEKGDAAYDFAHGVQTNPTLFIQSAVQSATQYLSLAHDQTNAVLLVGTGALVVNATALLPDANDAYALGVSGTAFSDLFLALGGVINWNASAHTITQAATGLTISGTAATSGLPVLITLTSPANTGITAGSNAPQFSMITSTQTWATGAIAEADYMVINAPTFAAAGASVIAQAGTLVVTAAPIAGTFTTITAGAAIWAQAGQYWGASGTGVAPTYSFSTDTDTGIYLSSPGRLNIVVGSVSRFSVDDGNNFVFGQASAMSTIQTPENALGYTWTIPIGGADAVLHSFLFQIDSNTWLSATATGNGAGGIGTISTVFNSNFTVGVGTKSDGIVTTVPSEITTTTAVQTTLLTLTLLDENTYHVEASVIGVKSDGSQRASYKMNVTAYRTGAGVAVIQGTITSLHSQESDATWDATFTVSGNNLLVSVTGVAATTIQWGGYLTYTNMSN